MVAIIMTKQDAKILGAVYACLLQHGAASQERIIKETKLGYRAVDWALWQLRGKEGGGLWTLPENMLPSGWPL